MWKTYKEWSEIYNDCIAPIVWVRDQVTDIGESLYDAVEDVLPTSSIALITESLKQLRMTVEMFESSITSGIGAMTGYAFAEEFFIGFKPPL